MTRSVPKGLGLLATVGIFVGMAHAAMTPGTNLYLNGALASNRVIEHNGIAYVPVADVAKALNQVVVPKTDGFAITSAGGANQVNGLQGKIGDKLTNGQLVLTVVKAFRTDKYDYQFGTDSATANQPTDDVVVVVLRIKNAEPAAHDLYLAGGGNTSVTDIDEHSYDGGYRHGGEDAHASAPTLLPGSAYDFALYFYVPKSEKLGDFLYQVRGYGAFKDTTFRVSLASLNSATP